MTGCKQVSIGALKSDYIILRGAAQRHDMQKRTCVCCMHMLQA